jgi:hypothetical protein
VLKRHGVIQRVEKMVPGLDRQASSSCDDIRIIGRWQFQGGKQFDITDSGSRGKSRCDGCHFGQPMHWLQDFQLPRHDRLHDGRCLVGIRFAKGILKQPFENHAGIEHEDHGRSAARALRISSLLMDGRLARALLSWRNTRLRLI